MILTIWRALLRWFKFRLPWSRKNDLLWSKRLENHAFGQFSMAAVQANYVMEDRSIVDAGSNVTLVGVFDGQHGSEASSYVNSELFSHLVAKASANQDIKDAIQRAVAETEEGFLNVVQNSDDSATQWAGTTCLLGVVFKGKLYVGNLGDSRAIVAYLDTNTKKMQSEDLNTIQSTSSDNIREELIAEHPDEQNLLCEKGSIVKGRLQSQEGIPTESILFIKGVTKVTNAIGYALLKSDKFSLNQRFSKNLLKPNSKPFIKVVPEIKIRDLQKNDKFLIFGTAEFWKYLLDEKAIRIVQENPRQGIAKRLLEKSLKNAAKENDLLYSVLQKYEEGSQRLQIHNDASVVVIFIDYQKLGVTSHTEGVCVKAPPSLQKLQ